MRLLGLLGIWLVKVLSGKGAAAGLMILCVWLEGRRLEGQGRDRDRELAQGAKALVKKNLAWVLAAAMGVSTLVSYGLLRFFDYRHAGLLALGMLMLGAGITAVRLRRAKKNADTEK